MRKLSHNKKRNLGLVYEFLTREIADAAVAKDRQRAANSLNIVSEHLSEGSVLFPELSLHRQVVGTRGVSERLAKRIVDELKAAGIRSSVNRTIIERSKSELIHEMNRTLGRDIFDRYRIPNYTAHASVNILMSRGLDGRLDEGVELARVEEHLVEFLTTSPAEAPKFDRDASLYAYKTAVGLFESEYGQELSAAQQELLREYVRVSLGGPIAPFERVFERQRASLCEKLRSARNDEVFKTDEGMARRLEEAIQDLSQLGGRADDEVVERVMLYHSLQREIES